MLRTPRPGCVTWRLCVRRHVRLNWLGCHEALSHPSSKARLSRAARWSPPQARNWGASALTGWPVANRSQRCSGVVGVARSNRPSQAKAFGSGVSEGSVGAIRRNAGSSGTPACMAGCARRLHQTAAPQPSAHVGWVAARRIRRSRCFFPCRKPGRDWGASVWPVATAS
jgi:hypothetical protein